MTKITLPPHEQRTKPSQPLLVDICRYQHHLQQALEEHAAKHGPQAVYWGCCETIQTDVSPDTHCASTDECFMHATAKRCKALLLVLSLLSACVASRFINLRQCTLYALAGCLKRACTACSHAHVRPSSSSALPIGWGAGSSQHSVAFTSACIQMVFVACRPTRVICHTHLYASIATHSGSQPWQH